MIEQPHRNLRFRDTMPKPVMAVFLLACVAAAVASAVVLLRGAGETVSLGERRPPPRAPYSHDAGRLAPAPLPSVIPTLAPACDAVAGARIQAGGFGVLRLRKALESVCRLAGGGVSADTLTAARGLRGVSLRFAGFDRSGVESTADFSTTTIWLNFKFAARGVPEVNLVPVLLHDAWHLANPGVPVTSEQELRARAVEAEACRQVIDTRKWPRWCHDAQAITALDHDAALQMLARAGYAS